jgi:hypothetical protein
MLHQKQMKSVRWEMHLAATKSCKAGEIEKKA